MMPKPASLPSFLIGILAFVALTALFGCASLASLGKKPSVAQRASYASSPNFDSARGVFLNLPEPERDSIWEANRERYRDGIDVSHDGAPPGFTLPLVKPDLAAFLARDTGFQVIWLGHSALALKIDSAVVLLDPVFGRASPVAFYKSPRFQPPPFTRDDLPDVDFIVISHEHYDHLEYATAKYYAKKNTKFIVPLGISAHLLHWGVKAENIIERDWWDSVTVAGIKFTATPALHTSGRRARATNLSQWASWVIRGAGRTVYFSGDTGYGKHFGLIGERFGPFDLVFLESGQYSRAWRSHMQPQHWPVAMRDLRSTNWFPIHWGVFSFAPHDWDDPIVAADTLARRDGLTLWTPRMGEVVDLGNPPVFEKWWVKGEAEKE